MTESAGQAIADRRASLRRSGEAFATAHPHEFSRLCAAWFLWLSEQLTFQAAYVEPSMLRAALAEPTRRPRLPAGDQQFWSGALTDVFENDWWDFPGDVVAAQMALGRALAHLVARRGDVSAWRLVEGLSQTTDFALADVDATLPRLHPAGGVRRLRLSGLLTQIASDYVSDPASAARVQSGIDVRAAVAELCARDVSDLFGEPRLSGYAMFRWVRAFRLGRRLMPREVFALHDLLGEPAAIRQCLADLVKPTALNDLVAAIRLAPTAFSGEVWDGRSLVVPTLLALATQHLIPEAVRSEDDAADADLESDRARRALDAIKAALMSREDNVVLGHHWLAWLIRTAGTRGAVRHRSGDRRNTALRAAIEQVAAGLQPLEDPVAFVKDRTQFRHTPAALAALATTQDEDGSLICRLLSETPLDVGERYEMSDPFHPTRLLGGAALARCERPREVWQRGWMEIYPQREAARYCMGGNTDRARHAGYLMTSWALGAIGFLIEERKADATALWLEGWGGVLESRLNERFDLGFWDAATLHFAAFWALLQFDTSPLPTLSQLIAPFEMSTLMASLLLTLSKNGVSRGALRALAEERGLVAQLTADIAAEQRDGRGQIMTKLAIDDLKQLLDLEVAAV